MLQNILTLRGKSLKKNIRQRYAVFSRCPENFSYILNLDTNTDHHHNLTTFKLNQV